MLKIGHRGAAGYAPENTLLSIKKALELGVDMIEFDVRLSKDARLVLIHDSTVNRTTNGRGKVSGKTLTELKKLDAGQGETIPTLEEALDLIDKKAVVNIELKGSGTAEPVAHVIAQYINKHGWTHGCFYISSFKPHRLEMFKRHLPHIPIGFVWLPFPWINPIKVSRKIDASVISVHKWFVNARIVEKAHKNDLKVYVYAANAPRDIEKAKVMGVDGIISNIPDRIE